MASNNSPIPSGLEPTPPSATGGRAWIRRRAAPLGISVLVVILVAGAAIRAKWRDSANPLRWMATIDGAGVIAAWRDRLYVSRYNSGGLRIYDTSDLRRPRLLNDWNGLGRAWDLAVLPSGILLSQDAATGAMKVLDCSDPVSPRLLAQTRAIPEGGSIFVDGHRVLLSGWGGRVAFDMSDPAKPREIDFRSTRFRDLPRSQRGAVASRVTSATYRSDKVAWVFSGKTPVVEDHSTSSTQARSVGNRATHLALDEEGTFLYTAEWDDGLRVWDLSNPASPEHAHRPLSGCFQVSVTGERVFTSGGYGEAIWDIIEELNPGYDGEIEVYHHDRNGNGRVD